MSKSTEMGTPTRPFASGERMSSSHLEPILDWLDENADPDLLLAGEYRVRDLLDDLNSILDGMWSDGIDAMGEDA